MLLCPRTGASERSATQTIKRSDHLPYLYGERTPIHDPHAKGILFGMKPARTRDDIYRAMLEGIALGTGHVIETYREVGQAPAKLCAVGGGIKNRVWSQATSDILGQAQVLRERSIGASYGDAFLAAVTLGDAGLEDIDRWNPVAGEIVPDAGNAAVYAKRLLVFKDLYEQNRDLMRELG